MIMVKKISFSLMMISATCLLAMVSCKQGDSKSSNGSTNEQNSSDNNGGSRNNGNPKDGTRLIKKITQDKEGKMTDYSTYIYNKLGQLDSIKKYDRYNSLSEAFAFEYNKDGSVAKFRQGVIEDNVVAVSFTYNNGIITEAEKMDGPNKTANYTFSYTDNKVSKIDRSNNTLGSNSSSVITYGSDGKLYTQTNPFFTSGSSTGVGFFASNDDFESDSLKCLEYYPQPIKSIAPIIDNLLIKYYVKKAQSGTDIIYCETTFNKFNNPIKVIKRLNDANGDVQSITLYEYE